MRALFILQASFRDEDVMSGGSSEEACFLREGDISGTGRGGGKLPKVFP